MPLFSNIISISDLSRKQIEIIIQTASTLKQFPEPNLLAGKIIASLFFEASTRTRLSFESAIYRLGGQVIGFSDGNNTSLTQKSESLEDTIQMINGYADALIMRHPQSGAAKIASDTASIPVINAGDGANEHPTQTLLDLFTIHDIHGRLDNLTIGLVGDLKYGRTIHSLIKAFSLFENITFYLLNEPEFELPLTLKETLEKNQIKVYQADSLDKMLPELDVLYMTRIQKERVSQSIDNKLPIYRLTKDLIQKYAKENLAILHPLPRQAELDISVDQLSQAHYFSQAQNGLYVREAILKLIFIDRL